MIVLDAYSCLHVIFRYKIVGNISFLVDEIKLKTEKCKKRYLSSVRTALLSKEIGQRIMLYNHIIEINYPITLKLNTGTL